jgi:adenylate cyclase, class 1
VTLPHEGIRFHAFLTEEASLRLKTIIANKKKFIQYNEARKRNFLELSSKDADIVLYCLPWLLSVNHPACPGYIRGLKCPVQVANILHDTAIVRREQSLRRLFSIQEDTPVLKFAPQANLILGIYTIGSAGTAAQTEHSDCDIWLCIDKRSYDGQALSQFYQKVNIVKDWLDRRMKLPVYFFISDLEDIRNCDFGQVDNESCGTAQKNILKEEFYRTMIVIAGKIPIWWVCYDGDHPVSYQEVVNAVSREDSESHDFVDLGDIESISQDEYYGAALWQLNKSLTYPLKSIMKMLMMKMQMDRLPEELLCRQFRETILGRDPSPAISDPSLFAMKALLDHYQSIPADKFEFIKQCLYLRFDIKMLSKRLSLKERLAADILAQYRIERSTLYHLNDFAAWPFSELVALGESIFQHLLTVYYDINAAQRQSSLSAGDMRIMGRKIASCLAQKTDKIPIIHKPISHMTLPALTFKTNGKTWQVCESANPSVVITAHRDIVACLAYVIRNGIYEAGMSRMEYNSTAITMQEIINLARMVRDTFGTHDISAIDFARFIEPEKIVKILVIVNFDGSPDEKDINDLHTVYENNWGELFVRRFRSREKFQSFVRAVAVEQNCVPEIKYYIQRNSYYYEKNIERTKQAVLQALKAGMLETII